MMHAASLHTSIVKKGLVGIGFSLLFAVADRSGWTWGIRGGLETAMRPSLHVVARAASLLRSVRGGISAALVNQNRIAELERQNATLSVQLLEAARRGDEHDMPEGGEALGSRFDLRESRVVTAGPRLVIENVGFEKGSVVVSAEGALVGIVDQVGKWTAGVQTVMVSQQTLPVLVTSGSRNAEGEIRGSPGGVVTLERVLTDVSLSEGMMIVSKGSDDSVPSGLLIGWVGKQREKKEEAVYQSVNVILAAKPDELRYVLVIAPGSIKQ
jgi:cell shape-determining protein MreC